MRLMLPISDSKKQALMGQAADALELGRLHAVREESHPDGTITVSAKFSDSFGFVDHPRLTAARPGGELVDFRCDCVDFWRTRRLCVHCAALADAFFEEVCSVSAPAVQEVAPEEAVVEPPAPVVSLPPLPIEQISYRFCNSRSDLYPGKLNPRIPLARYYQMFGENARARAIYKSHPGWGGSCFGFTTTIGMFLQPDDPVTVPGFRVGAIHPTDLLLTSRSLQLHMTLHTFIESMQILQSRNPVISRPRNNRLYEGGCLDELCRRVLQFQQTRRDPVGMAVWRSPRFDGGHSVFPYWLETSDQGQDRLYIYDPNHPMKTRYAYLDKDENGHYTNWRFPMNDYTEYSGATGGQLSFDVYEDYKKAWNERGGQSDAMMTVQRNVAIANTDGQVLFRVTAEGTESFCQDIYQILLTDLNDGEEETVQLSLPAGNYLVRSEDPQRESLQILFTHDKQSVSLRTSAPEAAILADDSTMGVSARIFQADCSYAVELDAVYEDASRFILLEGTTGEGGLCFGCFDGTLRAEGPLTEELACLYIDEELSDLACIERLKRKVPQREAVTEKKRSLVLCSDQPEADPSADETD